jgi:methionyl-tRNA formyltransferase
MGTAPLSCVCLQALISAPGFQVVAVVTQPDKPKGRDLKLTPSPVKEMALRQDLTMLQPLRAREPEFLHAMADASPGLIVVAAYGQILPQSILDLPRYGCLNVHTSLLPRYRGAAPIQWAILNGDAETGITIMKMDAGLDTGDILTQAKTPIEEQDTAEALHDRLARLGADLLVRTIPDYVAGKVQPRPQPPEGVSLAPKIRKEDGQIEWSHPARVIANRVRALVPWPGAFTHLKPHDSLIKIWQANVLERSGPHGEIIEASKAGVIVGCGQGAVRILELQREGGRRMSAQQFLAGHPLKPGDRFGSSKLQTPSSREAPSSKHQAPGKLQAPNSSLSPPSSTSPTSEPGSVD